MTDTKLFYDESSERFLLGCMLNDNKCIPEVMSKLNSKMFYFSKHKIIFENIIKLYKEGVTVDICSLNSEIVANRMIEQATGSGYIASLTNEVCSSANFSYYLNIVVKHAQSRDLRSTLVSNLEKIGNIENQEIIKNIEDGVFKISASTTQTKIWNNEELATEFNEYLKYNEETWGIEKGIKVGFPTLDRMTDGFQAEDVIIIGARPSIGKTALAISMMQNLLEKDVSFGFISAEMSRNQIMTRFVNQRTKIDSSTIRKGMFTTQAKEKLFEATSYYASKKFYIDDTPNISLNSLISSARHMKIHHAVKIIFIDYLGLISVEQDADLVILLNGQRDLSCYQNTNPFLERDLTLAKHRNGPCGKIYLDFEKQFTIFTEAKDQEERAEQELLSQMSKKEKDEYFANKNQEAC